jgi:radical SAM protein with 4Fe4S-binding SPASM domain
MLALRWDGTIYPCLRFMPSSLGNIKPIVIGNVNDGIMTTQEQRDEINKLKAINRINQSTEECINCPVAKGCSYCQAFNY